MNQMLIIDDNVEFRTMVMDYFTDLGYKVEIAGDGKEGLAKAPAFKPDLIFLDIMMPGLNGVEVLRELQAVDETAEVPVIVMSGKYFDQGMYDLFRQERNFKEFLAKPVSLNQLELKAAALLKHGA